MTKMLAVILLVISGTTIAQTGVRLSTAGKGWAANSVNAVIFRHNSLTSFNNTQYIAYYDSAQRLVIGKRTIGSTKWTLQTTPYSGKATDAHNTISIMTDGEGYLHVSWDHHNNALRYARSVSPGSLQLTDKMPMTGNKEGKVTYPEFYRLPNGNLLFLYRDGGSGNGNLMLNHYDTKTKKWTQLQDGWINGEGQRNAYWQMTIDKAGTLHISWVWRESPDVASNHDMGYARSKDGGRTWEKSTGEKYTLPITAATAEYACRIPQNSELINSTSMSTDDAGHPYIATYWRDSASTIPQYRLVYHNGQQWKAQQISNRITPFSLSGAGTKRIPISRPQIVVANKKGAVQGILIYRDIEQGGQVSVAISNNITQGKWQVKDLTTTPVGLWEPSYDKELWKKKSVLHLFVERVEQGDAETTKAIPPQPVQVLEWKP
ncbi:neuraminidase [Niastella caeni]|uniref:Neuraminidase n=1 Tax=Niastella caeni TaxID=2569763 RepID=A0A4S8I193_9BACT|nr:BNR repeat-containing protein [Niastella caeni]THU40959.1 neuraminidase [Niastella caeni]